MLKNTKVLLFGLSLFSLYVLHANAEQIGYDKISIVRQKSIRENALNTGNIEELGLYLDWLKTSIVTKKRKNDTTNDTIALHRYLDSEYYAQIHVGSPGQPMNVFIDTAWSTSWLLSKDCPTFTAGCKLHNLYDHKHSSTYYPNGKPFVVDQGGYNMTGYYSLDVMKFGHSKVTNQTFVEITYINTLNIFSKSDGVLGLGLKRSDGINPFFYNLIEQSLIKSPIFSIFLSRDKQSSKGGTITLGSIAKKHIHVTNKKYDEITYVPIDSETAEWQFSLDKVVVDDGKNATVLCPKGCKAIPDTSSTLIIGSKDDVEAINKRIGARQFHFGRFEVDCDTINKLPRIDFVIGGKNFNITGKNYVHEVSVMSIQYCLSAFTIGEAPGTVNRWILGGSFLSEYYSIYNIRDKKLGLVKAA